MYIFMQVLTASSHLGAVCLGVQGAAGAMPEKTQELYDQSECDSSGQMTIACFYSDKS